ncbi:potassium channel family protein [Paenibacillus sp. YPG26]|uniref:potassium channel family protein n=1 Tax=Paenibacillus sp. YPG26 TaxID=2878915 RepID=UPI002042051A|nr:potassium channel family protein [Paenibacillus sp. YPG26]USB32514.1 potassium channel family protein [Paenibacillus sp. YPG26]
MQTLILFLDAVALIVLAVLFYRVDKRITGRVILLAPVIIYIALCLQDLLGLIDFASVLAPPALMRAVILLFVLFSVIFYIIFIFHRIALSVNKEVQLKSTVIRIFSATVMCILFFMVVYTSIYKTFGESAFKGDNIGDSLISQLISFLYFSLATFATVGYGDIRPVDDTSRLVVIMEILFSFVTVAYALSMIGVFRQIFKEEPLGGPLGGPRNNPVKSDKGGESDEGIEEI